MADERIPDEVLREPTIYDEHTGEWLGGWPDEGRAEDAIDRLKGELKACRAVAAVVARSREEWVHDDGPSHLELPPDTTVAEFIAMARACLPGGGRRDARS